MMFGIHQILNTIFHTTLFPGVFFMLWLYGVITFGTLKIILVLCFIIFVLLPIIFKYSVTLQRGILFLTFISYPRNLDYKNPSSIGLYATRNFYVKVKDSDVEDVESINIGVWHVLPIQIAKNFSKELQLEEKVLEEINNVTGSDDSRVSDINFLKLKSEFPAIDSENEENFYESLLKVPVAGIILYLHGNTASRGSGHRVELYQLLRKLGFHVITLDYRSYGDSDSIAPTEEGVVKDALAVYDYIRNLTDSPVLLWGHSLGTGVSTHLMSILTQQRIPGPSAVVLESPFTNIRDETRNHPFAKLFRKLPWFDYTIVEPMYANSLRFESDQHISEFRQPVMILHAEDDLVVPFELGYKLYRAALDNRARSWGPVEFHRFDGSSNYGHKYLCRAPNLSDLVQKFFENYRNENYR